MTAGGFHEDCLDLLRALAASHARFLIVGAHAMAVHGVPRTTGHLDIWIDPAAVNVARVWAALVAFGAPLAEHGLSVADLQTPGTVYQIGFPPRRLDLLTSVSGLGFEEAWERRPEMPVAGISVPFLGREDLIRNKLASGREKDLLDVRLLERVNT